MSIRVTVTVTNDNPDTIYNQLRRELGREPTNAECRERIRRIISST